MPGGLDEPLDPREAAAGLARRWLAAFGPGTRTDLQWWAGWTVTTTSARWPTSAPSRSSSTSRDRASCSPTTSSPATAPGPSVALLPGLDPTTMGWKQRAFHLDPAASRGVFDRNGNGGPDGLGRRPDRRRLGAAPDGDDRASAAHDVGAERRDEIDRAATGLQELLGDVRFSVRFPAPVQAALL